MQLAIALVVTLVSACCLNAGYVIEHGAVSKLPPLSVRRPLSSVRLLLAQRRWLAGFGIEVLGWALYVVALALAPLSLVQATAAGGIGILAVMVSAVTGVSLTPRERTAVLVSIAGLALLGASLAAGQDDDGSSGSFLEVGLWLAASGTAALVAVRLGARFLSGGAAFGLATGILFAAGDVATKATVGGGTRLAFAPALIVAYALGTLVLQSGFQRGGPLTTAGIATLFTNALPIIAGMTIFAEPLPGGWAGALRILAFVLVVVGAVGLARPERSAAPTQEPNAGDEACEVGVPARG